ncbi:MAG: hypothetical protein IPK89_13500 [Sphingomonadales bacterium]|nr:hypothetical protein [Sphingomonadales bacterium]
MDIWACVLLGATTLLTATCDRLSFGVKTYLALVIMFAISAHASIPPANRGRHDERDHRGRTIFSAELA